jgi:phenylalanyl-tRNA synthetase alpha chain
MNEQIEALHADAVAAIGAADTLQALEELRVRFLGRKSELTQLRKGIGGLTAEERPTVGKLLTELQGAITSTLESRTEGIRIEERQRALEAEQLDISLPGRRRALGGYHPITQTKIRMCEIFRGLGFEEVEGPEVETEYYNFDALNTPSHHPARDMHDTFYITDSVLLRTHTSPMQIRYMETRQPPIRIVVPGRVYRRDADVSHSPMFHQLEGLLVDRDVRFSDLKGVLAVFAREMFGPDTRVRFRPSYFPFTEPSAEVDISCIFCEGDGCRVCKRTGWIEVLGTGAVDPEVFRAVGYDPEVYTGFAFGMGIDRAAMLRHRINNIRILFENDMRFLTQF